MKHKISNPNIANLVQNDHQCIGEINGNIQFPEPNEMIYKFEGTITLDHFAQPMSLSIENFLL